MGVDFWWLDWQQNYLYPHVRGHHSTTLAWINELYYRDSMRRKRGAGCSRWADGATTDTRSSSPVMPRQIGYAAF